MLGVGVWRDFQSPEVVMRARKPKAKKRVKKSSHSFIWFFSLFCMCKPQIYIKTNDFCSFLLWVSITRFWLNLFQGMIRSPVFLLSFLIYMNGMDSDGWMIITLAYTKNQAYRFCVSQSDDHPSITKCTLVRYQSK